MNTTERTKLEAWFVNLYRIYWDSNAGLSSERIRNAPDYELTSWVESLLKATEKKRARIFGGVDA